jgi:hypothetical protein
MGIEWKVGRIHRDVVRDQLADATVVALGERLDTLPQNSP